MQVPSKSDTAGLLNRLVADELPSGEPSLANEVTILAELQFVRPGAETSE